MATLGNKAIRGSLHGVFGYVSTPDKNLPSDCLSRAAAYIRGGHSVETHSIDDIISRAGAQRDIQKNSEIFRKKPIDNIIK